MSLGTCSNMDEMIDSWKEFRKVMIRKFVTSIHQSIQKFEVGYEIFVSHVCSFVNCILVNGGDKRRQGRLYNFEGPRASKA